MPYFGCSVDAVDVQALAKQLIGRCALVLLDIGHVWTERRQVDARKDLMLAGDPSLFRKVEAFLKVHLIGGIEGALSHLCKIISGALEHSFTARTCRCLRRRRRRDSYGDTHKTQPTTHHTLPFDAAPRRGS